MNAQTLREDLAYVRDLAEAGQSAPLLGGRFFVWWGLLAALAYAAHYGVVADQLPISQGSPGWVWLGFVILGSVGHALLMRGLWEKPGAASVGNRTEAAIWQAGGLTLGVFFLGIVAASMITGEISAGFNWSVPFVFAVYGIAMVTSGTMGQNGLLVKAGYAAIAFVGLSALLVMRPELYLVAAFAAATTIFLPGVALLRGEPHSVV